MQPLPWRRAIGQSAEQAKEQPIGKLWLNRGGDFDARRKHANLNAALAGDITQLGRGATNKGRQVDSFVRRTFCRMHLRREVEVVDGSQQEARLAPDLGGALAIAAVGWPKI